VLILQRGHSFLAATPATEETLAQDATLNAFGPAHGLIFEGFDPSARSATSVS